MESALVFCNAGKAAQHQVTTHNSGHLFRKIAHVGVARRCFVLQFNLLFHSLSHSLPKHKMMTKIINPLRLFFAAFLAAVFLLPATAQQASDERLFVADVDYILLDPPLPVRVGDGEIEVIEFFNYSCPHCFRTQAYLKKWQDSFDMTDVTLVQQPVFFQTYNGLFARFYYTLVALGVEDELAKKFYDALHKEKRLINSPGRFVDWLADNGVDSDRAEAALDSFSVKINTERAKTFPADYGVNSTPQFAVAGKYIVTPALSGTLENMFAVISYLVDLERAGAVAQ